MSCTEYRRNQKRRLAAAKLGVPLSIYMVRFFKRNRPPRPSEKPSLTPSRKKESPSAKAARLKYRSKPEVRARMLERGREYFKINKLAIYENRRRNVESNPCHRIKRNLRARLWDAIRRARPGSRAGSAVRDLGCSIEHFRDYIASRFEPGMSWDNWGPDTWHIDHIKPLANFDLTDRGQFLEACHYTNMRPLWKSQNLSRSRGKSKTYQKQGAA